MGLKRKQILAGQKAHFEKMLEDRLASLAGKDIKPPKTNKDPIVKKLKAQIKASDRRLRAIAECDKRGEDAAKAKAAALAAAKAAREEELSGKKIEKPKKAAPEAKEKKPKPEKKAKPQAEGAAPKPPKEPKEKEPEGGAPAA